MSNMGHHGGENLGLAQTPELGQPQHGFVAHLLGLDHMQAGHQGAVQHGQQQQQASRDVFQGANSSASIFSPIKITDLLQGIHVTANQLFLLLFASFIVWLFVIYWVRHHEPLANQVLVGNKGVSSTADVDRQLVAGARAAMPIRTSAYTGGAYLPPAGSGSPNSQESMQNTQTNNESAQPTQSTAQQQMQTPPVAPSQSTYLLPIRTSEGMRLKTVTNR